LLSSTSDSPATTLTGLILAGGAGRRFGGADKGLQRWCGQPLAGHVAAALAPQVQRLLLSCNRNRERYRAIVKETVVDRRSGFCGPLAGLEAAAGRIETPLLVIAPCDTPRLPPDLARRLSAPLAGSGSGAPKIAYASDGQRCHYLHAALRRECLGELGTFLDGGGRAVRDYFAGFRCTVVDFSDCADAFLNVNAAPGARRG